MTVWQCLVALLCVSTCFRILFYQRNGSSFKWRYSLLAYVLMLFTNMVGLTLTNAEYQLHPILVIALLFLAVGVFSCRGNVALMMHLLTRRLV